MKTIGFDAQPLFRNRDGVGTYTLELIKAAATANKNKKYIGIYFNTVSPTRDTLAAELASCPNVYFVKSPVSWQIVRFFAEFGIWLPIDKIIRIKFDGFIYPNFTCLPWVSKHTPKALVIHDAVYRHYPQTVSKPNLYYLNKFVEKSSHKPNVSVFSVSNHAANDLEKILKIGVAPAEPGSSSNAFHASQSEKYLLFVGTIEPRKNLDRLIDAYSKLDEITKKEHPLYIVGGIGWQSNETIRKLEQTKYVQYLGRVDDTKRDLLMHKMYAFVMPSIYEGFGIPVLDAALIKKPILTSANSPMSEITSKKGAILVDPKDCDSILKGLITLLNLKPQQLQEMTQRALQNATKYTWDKTSKKILAALEAHNEQ